MGALTRARWPIACIALICTATAGCIGVSPEQAEADALGPDPGGHKNGPLHRAGFPCTRCHGDAWWQESPVFELAGTVYRRSGDQLGLRDAEVVVQDADGRELVARTNRTGNFFFVRGGRKPEQKGDGRFNVPFALAYPLRVRVRAGEQEQAMRGLIWREASCATCHSGDPGTDSNGRVFVEEATP